LNNEFALNTPYLIENIK